jgi:hypothetical protein
MVCFLGDDGDQREQIFAYLLSFSKTHLYAPLGALICRPPQTVNGPVHARSTPRAPGSFSLMPG